MPQPHEQKLQAVVNSFAPSSRDSFAAARAVREVEDLGEGEAGAGAGGPLQERSAAELHRGVLLGVHG